LYFYSDYRYTLAIFNNVQLAEACDTNTDDNNSGHDGDHDWDADANINENDYDEGEEVDGPAIHAYVELPKRPSEYVLVLFPPISLMGPITAQKCSASQIATQFNQPNFLELVRRFLHDQLHPDGPHASGVPLQECPTISGNFALYKSAAATFYAPSDPSGVNGMRREHIRATHSWRCGGPRYDCVFINVDPEMEGFHGLDVVRVFLFFSFCHFGKFYPCALVQWYSKFSNAPDEDTGMWIVSPEMDDENNPVITVIHLDCIFRAAHLLGVSGRHFLDKNVSRTNSLDAFKAYYVNKFIDNHASEIAK
jgi:hypothetical protein